MIPYHDLKKTALNLGWDDVGVTHAVVPEKDILAYKQWLQKKGHGDLKYMENQIRCYPEQMLEGARSAVIFISYYKQKKLPFKTDSGLIASYARGRDYHNIHRKRLKKMIAWLEEFSGEKNVARGFSDSAPVLEKALAVQAGLGWLGKNTLLIHRRFGTFTLLSGLFTTLDLEKTPPLLKLDIPRCGSCQRCVDACPAGALDSPYTLDAKKCLSYHLIESKKDIPLSIQKKNPGYVFGCDICQDVCPHNLRKPICNNEDFSPKKGLGEYLCAEKLHSISCNPETLFGSPLNRRGSHGLKNNFDSMNPSKT